LCSITVVRVGPRPGRFAVDDGRPPKENRTPTVVSTPPGFIDIGLFAGVMISEATDIVRAAAVSGQPR
jgi:hypothetical protein